MIDDKNGNFTFERTDQGDLILDGTVVERDPAAAEAASASLPTAQPAPTHIRLDDEDVSLDEIRRLRKRFPELESTVREIEPFREVIQSPLFQEWLESAVENQEFTPIVKETPAPSDVVGYRKRQQDPEFNEIVAEMNTWAKALPVQDRHLIDNSHKRFNEVYDIFKQLHGGAQVGREIAERELRKRERAYDASITVRSDGGVDRGGSESYGDGSQGNRQNRRIEILKAQSRRGNRDAEVLLAKALLEGDDK